jgi:hypothetical protein
MKRNVRILAAAVLIAVSPIAAAQAASPAPGQSLVAGRLATSFTSLAGSPENALALVNALRTGSEVTLFSAPAGGTGDPVATTFTLPTKPMGWGNVSHSLALAQSVLAQQGITNPTSAELQAALLGGDLVRADGTTVTLDGVLAMRASGMGWGNIAKASGTTMGAVASSTKAMQGKPAAAPAPAPVTTAAGTTQVAGPATAKGIATAAGGAASASARGVVTAEGALATHGRSAGITTGASTSGGGNGHAYGRGLVTASGSAAGAGAASAAATGRGAGLVTASGAAAASGASVTTAAGPGNGNGRGNAQGRGKGGI